MSDFHKVPSPRHVNKSSRQIDNVEPRHDRPWFTAECKRLYDIYRKALADFNKSKSLENHELLKSSKRQYKILERRIKRKYLNEEGN